MTPRLKAAHTLPGRYLNTTHALPGQYPAATYPNGTPLPPLCNPLPPHTPPTTARNFRQFQGTLSLLEKENASRIFMRGENNQNRLTLFSTLILLNFSQQANNCEHKK